MYAPRMLMYQIKYTCVYPFNLCHPCSLMPLHKSNKSDTYSPSQITLQPPINSFAYFLHSSAYITLI